MSLRPRWRRRVRTGIRCDGGPPHRDPDARARRGAGAFALLLYGQLPGTVPQPHDRVVSMPSVVYDASGKEIGSFHEYELTVPVKPSDIPQVMKDAMVAAEDRHFWEHDGVDVRGLARAAATDAKAGQIVEGGSTITQQLVKNRYLSSERSLGRKLDEAVLAVRLEREMSKEQILFEYLDTTYFGGGAYGVGAAAKTYFHTSVRDLSASQAATLAGLVPAPTRYDPRSNPAAAEHRRLLVLREMHDQGYLTAAEYRTASSQPLRSSAAKGAKGAATVYYPQPGSSDSPYPYFLDYVRRYLVDRYGADRVFRGGLRVYATLDPARQAQAQAAVERATRGHAGAARDDARQRRTHDRSRGRTHRWARLEGESGQPRARRHARHAGRQLVQTVRPRDGTRTRGHTRLRVPRPVVVARDRLSGLAMHRAQLRRQRLRLDDTPARDLVIREHRLCTARQQVGARVRWLRPRGDSASRRSTRTRTTACRLHSARPRSPRSTWLVRTRCSRTTAFAAPVTPVVRVVGPDGHVLEDNSAPARRPRDGCGGRRHPHRRAPRGGPVRDGPSGVDRAPRRREDGHFGGLPGGVVRRVHPAARDVGVDGICGCASPAARHRRVRLDHGRHPPGDRVGGIHAVRTHERPDASSSHHRARCRCRAASRSIGAPARDSVGGVPTSCGGLCDRASSDSSAKASKKSSKKTDSSASAKAKDAKTTTTTAKGTDHG